MTTSINDRLQFSRRIAVGWVAALFAFSAMSSWAGPFVSPTDVALRHDIQLLADAGVIRGPISTWPLAWGPILADLASVDSEVRYSPDVVDAIARVSARANWETRSGEVYFGAHVAVAEEPTRIRAFDRTPRESAEFGAGLTYTGERFTVALNAQVVDSASDGEDLRADGSVIGVVLGNYSLSVNTLERWWGPGWDGSLILSNNARPVPAVSIDRNFTDPFSTRWLRWIGPWDVTVHFGQMESDRAVPNAQFFGLRFNFKPIPSLEIGLSRTAQWCGDGRPCNVETFFDLLAGRDNLGDDSINRSTEPGNQLAGFDLRWSPRFRGLPLALYGQFIGEDEAGGLPSRYLGQMGIEGTGFFRNRWAYRWFAEFAATSCRFHQPDEFNNCAYNNGIYQTGYRYRGRSVGHPADGDARLISAGVMLVDADETQWYAVARSGELNRGDVADVNHTLTATSQDVFSIDVTYKRWFRFGRLAVGAGLESIDDKVSGSSDEDVRAFVQWQSSY